MKKVIYATLLVVAITMLPLFTSCDKNGIFGDSDNGEIIVTNPRTGSETPTCIQEFVNTHFNGIIITRIKTDLNDYDYYSVKLSNGFELEFTQACNWLDIEGHNNEVPTSILNLLPSGIMQYLSAEYPGRKVIGVSKEHYGYEIELNRDLDIKFDSNGVFLRRDRD